MNSGKKKVTIIDYHLGNLFSVKQACDVIGIDAYISADASDVESADALILPGVGAFIEAMNNLEQLNLIEPVRKAAEAGKPIFGICLGLQLLFSESEEFGSGKGLGLVPGLVKKFSKTHANSEIRVPQIGWNNIYKSSLDWTDTPLKDIREDEYMYFVHSYYVEPAEEIYTLTKTNYEGIEYCSSILKNNIFATQFHPEKSSEKGLSIYRNWAIINNII
jgi:glutamine amidotransferase